MHKQKNILFFITSFLFNSMLYGSTKSTSEKISTSSEKIETSEHPIELTEDVMRDLKKLEEILKKHPGKADHFYIPVGHTPLSYAASHGLYEAAKMLITYGADANNEDYKGYTPLTRAACFEDKPEMINLFLDNGAEIDKPCYTTQTPLMLAAKAGGLENVKVLIARGAKINLTKYHSYKTALFYALIYEKNEVAAYLLQQGAQLKHIAETLYTHLL